MPLDEGLDRGEQGMPAGLRRAPATDVQLARQPGREHLQRGRRQTHRLGRAVVIDVAGQLEQELRGQIPQAGAGKRTAASWQSRLRDSGNRDGGNMKVIIWVGRSPPTPHATS